MDTIEWTRCPQCNIGVAKITLERYHGTCNYCSERNLRRKAQEEDKARVKYWMLHQEELLEKEEDLSESDIQVILKDWIKGGWMDEQSHEYVGRLLKKIMIKTK